MIIHILRCTAFPPSPPSLTLGSEIVCIAKIWNKQSNKHIVFVPCLHCLSSLSCYRWVSVLSLPSLPVFSLAVSWNLSFPFCAFFLPETVYSFSNTRINKNIQANTNTHYPICVNCWYEQYKVDTTNNSENPFKKWGK